MKKIYLPPLLTLLLLSTCYLPMLFAQSVGMPEGAIARLGKGRIYDVKYTDDGTRLAVATSAGVWLIDATTYKELTYLTQRGIAMHKRIAFSPDSRVVVSADKYESIANGLIQQWNVNNRWHPRGIRTSGEIYSLAFSPDGKTLVSGNDDIRFWDPQTRDLKMELKRPSEVKKWALISLAFSADGKVLAGAFWKTICLWDTQTGKHIQTLEGHENNVDSLTFSVDGGTEDGIYYKVAVSPDGSLFAAADNSGTIGLFRTKTGERIHTLEGHSRYVLALTFSADIRTIASGSRDGSIRIWEVASGEKIHTFAEHYGNFSCFSASADGKTIVSVGRDRNVCLWDATSGKLQKIINRKGISHVIDIALSADGKTIVFEGSGGIGLWDTETGTRKQTLKWFFGDLWSVAFSPDGRTIAGGNNTKTLYVWDADTGDKKHVINEHKANVIDVAFSPNSKTIVSVGQDRTVRLWDTETGEQKKVINIPENSVFNVAFSPDGKTFTTVNYTDKIHLWDVETGEQKGLLEGHEQHVTAIVFSPDGKMLATGNQRGVVNILDVRTGRLLQTFAGHVNRVDRVAFVSDGSALASMSDDDGILYLWGVAISE